MRSVSSSDRAIWNAPRGIADGAHAIVVAVRRTVRRTVVAGSTPTSRGLPDRLLANALERAGVRHPSASSTTGPRTRRSGPRSPSWSTAVERTPPGRGSTSARERSISSNNRSLVDAVDGGTDARRSPRTSGRPAPTRSSSAGSPLRPARRSRRRARCGSAGRHRPPPSCAAGTRCRPPGSSSRGRSRSARCGRRSSNGRARHRRCARATRATRTRSC